MSKYKRDDQQFIEAAFESAMTWVQDKYPEHEDFTNGYCDAFAKRLAKYLGPKASIENIHGGHWYVEFEGRCFDASGELWATNKQLENANV